MDSFFFVTR